MATAEAAHSHDDRMALTPLVSYGDEIIGYRCGLCLATFTLRRCLMCKGSFLLRTVGDRSARRRLCGDAKCKRLRANQLARARRSSANTAENP